MSNRRSLLSGVLVVCSGQGLVQLLMLGRNVVLARLLGPAEMGSAAALVITASLLDMISNLSADKLLIQAADGDSPRFQATAQAIHVIRGVVQAMGLVLLGGAAAVALTRLKKPIQARPGAST